MMKRDPQPAAVPRSHTIWLILAAGLVLTGWVAYDAHGVFERLPVSQYRRVPSESWGKAARAIVKSSQVTANAWDLTVGSWAIREAYLGHMPIDEARSHVGDVAGRVPLPLARLQLATILLMEAKDEPPDARWARVKDILPGLETADFSHHLDLMLRTVAGGFELLGVDKSVALTLAFEDFGYGHGPFLEIVAPQLAELTKQRRDGGDQESAHVCSAILTQLLTQWVAEPGPPGLRMLAADLLERMRRAGAIDDPQVTAMIDKVSAWRADYRARMAKLPGSMLGLASVPQPCVATQRALVSRILFASWMIVVTLVAGLIALLGLWFVHRARAFDGALGQWAIRGLLLAGLVVAGGVVLLTQTQIGINEVRLGFPTEALWVRHMWYAIGTLVGLAVLAGAVPTSRHRRWMIRSLSACLVGWVVLAFVAAVAVRLAESARGAHSAATATSYADRVLAVVGRPGPLDVSGARISLESDKKVGKIQEEKLPGLAAFIKGLQLLGVDNIL